MRNLASAFASIAITLAAPAAAQGAPPARPDAAAEMARRIADPATAQQISRTMDSLTKALLDLRVGEIQAAVEGRAATPAERRLTVRDLGRRDDRDFDRKIAQQIAQSRPMVEQSLKAMSQALPAITQSLKQAGDAIERAAANMPDPTYPRR